MRAPVVGGEFNLMNPRGVCVDQLAENAASSERIKLALVSTGLGNVNRGFEISAARWFEALRTHSSLDVKLFCGGEYPGGVKLWNMPRDSKWTSPFRALTFLREKLRWELCYGVEQISFWPFLGRQLRKWRPDAVWIKDIPLAHFLMITRRLFGLKFKIIFCNGGMLRPQTYKDFDVIQQMSLAAYEQALQFGIPPSKMSLISNCCPTMQCTADRTATRVRLGYAPDDYVVISVAAWNKYHKRIDYLIREVAAVNDPRVKLLLCGAPEVDTQELKELGEHLLGDRIQWMTVAPNMVPDLLNASDVFVLSSLRESLGNALLEAVLIGMPVVSHPHDGARFILQNSQWMTDLSVEGALRNRLIELKQSPPAAAQLEELRSDVAARFSDSTLAHQFESMVAAGVEGK
jgi:1,2-diacylglycerol 3-alpha-glucosyltransferase